MYPVARLAGTGVDEPGIAGCDALIAARPARFDPHATPQISALFAGRMRCWHTQGLMTRAKCRVRSAFKVTCAGRTFRIRSKTSSLTAAES